MAKSLTDALRWMKEAGYNPMALKRNISEALYERAVLYQVFIKQEYKRLWGSARKGTTVIDIGAFIGDSAIYFAMNPNVSKVYAYEPLPSSFKKLQHNVRLSGMSKISAYNAFVSEKVGGKSVSNELVNNAVMNYDNISDAQDGTNVKTISLGSILKGKKNVMIKCDAESAGPRIFKGADLSQVYALELEFHKGPSELAAWFRKKGYKVTYESGTDIGIMFCYRG